MTDCKGHRKDAYVFPQLLNCIKQIGVLEMLILFPEKVFGM